jgi:hypothetical protein
MLILITSVIFFASNVKDVSATLLTDEDGLNVGLFEDGISDNKFGSVGTGVDANNLATGYIPNVTFGPVLSTGISDGTQLEASFFDSSIVIRQYLNSSGNGEGGLFSITNGWNMIIEDIEWPDGSEVIGASISDSTFLSDFLIDFTASSVSLLYIGAETIEMDAALFATLNIDVSPPAVDASAPSAWLLLLLGGCAVIRMRNANTKNNA